MKFGRTINCQVCQLALLASIFDTWFQDSMFVSDCWGVVCSGLLLQRSEYVPTKKYYSEGSFCWLEGGYFSDSSAECLSDTNIWFRHFNYLIQVHPFQRKGSIKKSQVLPQSGLVFDWNWLIPAHALVNNYQLHLSTGTWLGLKGPSHSHMTTRGITEKQNNIDHLFDSGYHHNVL